MFQPNALAWHAALCRRACFLVLFAGCGQNGKPVCITSNTSASLPANGVLEVVEPTSVIETKSNVLHNLQVVVKNSGTRNLEGVSPRLSCNCHVLRPLPPVLLAGMTGTVEFRILTPFAGTQSREIDFQDKDQKFVGRINVTLKASGEVPRALKVARPVSIRHVAGERCEHGVEIETIEAVNAVNFVTGAIPEDSLVVRLGKPIVHDTPSFDRLFVRRNYRFPVEVLQDEPGNWETGVHIQCGNSDADFRMPVSLHILPRVLLLPQQLTVHMLDIKSTDDVVGTFRLIPRVPGETYEPETFDRALLSVKRTSQTGLQEWEVRIVRRDTATTTTEITLLASNGHRAQLPVQIEP